METGDESAIVHVSRILLPSGSFRAREAAEVCGMVVIVMLLGHLYLGEGMRVICVFPYRASS